MSRGVLAALATCCLLSLFSTGSCQASNAPTTKAPKPALLAPVNITEPVKILILYLDTNKFANEAVPLIEQLASLYFKVPFNIEQAGVICTVRGDPEQANRTYAQAMQTLEKFNPDILAFHVCDQFYNSGLEDSRNRFSVNLRPTVSSDLTKFPCANSPNPTLDAQLLYVAQVITEDVPGKRVLIVKSANALAEPLASTFASHLEKLGGKVYKTVTFQTDRDFPLKEVKNAKKYDAVFWASAAVRQVGIGIKNFVENGINKRHFATHDLAVDYTIVKSHNTADGLFVPAIPLRPYFLRVVDSLAQIVPKNVSSNIVKQLHNPKYQQMLASAYNTLAIAAAATRSGLVRNQSALCSWARSPEGLNALHLESAYNSELQLDDTGYMPVYDDFWDGEIVMDNKWVPYNKTYWHGRSTP